MNDMGSEYWDSDRATFEDELDYFRAKTSAVTFDVVASTVASDQPVANARPISRTARRPARLVAATAIPSTPARRLRRTATRRQRRLTSSGR